MSALQRQGKAAAYAMTGPADLDDQRWLDRQITAVKDGVQAVLDIAHNWTDGRNLARLHRGVSASEYVTSRVGTLGKDVVPVLLAESDWSNRQIAAVAGVSDETVNRAARATNVAPRDVLGADGKTYPPRTVTAVVIDTPALPHVPIALPSRSDGAVLRRCVGELRRIRSDYAELLSDPRAARVHPVLAAIDAALS